MQIVLLFQTTIKEGENRVKEGKGEVEGRRKGREGREREEGGRGKGKGREFNHSLVTDLALSYHQLILKRH